MKKKMVETIFFVGPRNFSDGFDYKMLIAFISKNPSNICIV